MLVLVLDVLVVVRRVRMGVDHVPVRVLVRVRLVVGMALVRHLRSSRRLRLTIPARRAAPEQRQLVAAELEPGGRRHPRPQVAQDVVVQMGDRAALAADDVVVGMVVGGLVEHAPPAEVRPQHEPLFHEEVERAVDRRGVDPRQLGPHPRRDLGRTEMAVRLGRERGPDQRPLARQAPAARSQLRRPARVRMLVAVRVGRAHAGARSAPGRGRSRTCSRSNPAGSSRSCAASSS